MSSKNILAIDDDPKNLRILKEIFDTGAVLHQASNGIDALRKFEEVKPDVVLLDIMMPGMDGYEVCRRLRALDKGHGTKVILVSSKAMLEERLQGYESGADDYVTKPFVPEELEAKVNAFLRTRDLELAYFDLNRRLEEQISLRTEQLLAQERVAYLGMNTAQIVHNLNGPLSIIVGYLSLLQEKYTSDPQFTKLSVAVEHLQEIVTLLLNSVRHNEHGDESDVDLSQVLAEELKLLEGNPRFKYGIRTSFAPTPLPSVRGHKAHFSQIFGNILSNAVDAMHESPERSLEISVSESEGAVKVAIRDSGCGIPHEHVSRIFDPFFTTKPAHGEGPTGTGLGLASVKKMLDSYGGTICVDSEPGRGSLFTLTLPLKRKP